MPELQRLQASHAAASVGLDALAAVRRARGQHAISIGWGLWRQIGSAADREALIRRMAGQGLGAISNETGAAVLGWALGSSEAAVAVLPIDRPRFLATFQETRPPAALRGWQAGRRVPADAPVEAAWLDGAGLADIVSAEAASVLGYRPNQPVDPAANLFELGLDSLMAV